jgi:transcriptional regulator with XRE-family HTH domain
VSGGRLAEDGPGPVAVAFGEKVKELHQGQSVRAFAKRLGISHGFLSEIQQGKAKPSRSLVKRIEEVAGAEDVLLPEYAALLGEWAERDQARAERRRQLAQREAQRAEDRHGRAAPLSAAGPDTRGGGYAATATSPDLQAGGRARGEEAEANRREVAKAGLGALLLAGATRAQRLLRWAETPNVGPLTLEELDESAVWLSENLAVLPTARLLEVADRRAADVAELLVEGRHSGAQRTRLELLAGQLAYLQGRVIAFNVGNYQTARMHLRVARHFGRQLDHHLLLASIADLESTLAFYQGQHQKALDLALQGRRYATAHTAARLAVDVAKAYGGLGPDYRREMHAALDQAERQLPDVLVYEPGATLPFGQEMFAYHAGTACVRAADARAADFAWEAIRQYEELARRQDQRSSFANLASARLDLAMTLLQGDRPDPKEASRLAIQALAMPKALHVDQVRRRVNELLAVLQEVPSWRKLPAVRELGEVARAYRPMALPAPSARRALGSS